MAIGKSEMVNISDWDVTEYLETKEDVTAYLNVSLEDGDSTIFSAALGDIARAKGMTRLTCETGIARDDFYKALRLPAIRPSIW